MSQSVVNHRRALHRIPELDDHLPETLRYVRSVLEPLGCAPLTGSMISNYVKKGLVKNPVKKQYDREHIAVLLMIAVAKTVLSLEEVQTLLDAQRELPVPQAYGEFCRTFPAAVEAVFSRPAGELMEDTVTAVAHKLYLDKRFGPETI